jgi:hypothetical protein
MADAAEELAEACAGWAAVSTPAAVRELIEALPEGFGAVSDALTALADRLTELAGPTLAETIDAIHGMATTADILKQNAEDAAVEFGEESAFWMNGD